MSLCHPWDASRVAGAAFDLVGSGNVASSGPRSEVCEQRHHRLEYYETSFFAGGPFCRAASRSVALAPPDHAPGQDNTRPTVVEVVPGWQVRRPSTASVVAIWSCSDLTAGLLFLLSPGVRRTDELPGGSGSGESDSSCTSDASGA